MVLVGSVHFNPASIELARRTVLIQEELGAVVVESCEARWRRTLEVSPKGSFLGDVLPSEMMAASEAAAERGVPLSLGDVDVETFGPRVKTILRETLVDMLTPAGWRRITNDIRRGAKLAFDTSDLADFLSPSDFLNPSILLGFLVSLVRYPIAAALKAPLPFAVIATGLASLSSALDSALAESSLDASLTSGELILTSAITAFDVLLPVVFSRLLLVGFLEERNVRLARSISEAAERGNGAVVAVLGGLHVNGVAKLLESGEELKGDGGEDTKAGTWWTDKMMLNK